MLREKLHIPANKDKKEITRKKEIDWLIYCHCYESFLKWAAQLQLGKNYRRTPATFEFTIGLLFLIHFNLLR